MMFFLLSHRFTAPCSLHVIVTKVKEVAGDCDLVGTAHLAIPWCGKLKAKRKGAWQQTIMSINNR